MARTPEGAVKEKVKQVLKKHDVWYFMPVTGGYSQNGVPDYICCVPPTGRLLGVECKAHDNGQPTSLQMVQLHGIRAHGGLTFLATPSTVADLDVMLTLLIHEDSP